MLTHFFRLSADEKILALADAYEKSGDKATAYAEIAALVGRRGSDVIRIIQLGTDAIREQGNQAKYTVDQLNRIEELGSMGAHGLRLLRFPAAWILAAPWNLLHGRGRPRGTARMTSIITERRTLSDLIDDAGGRVACLAMSKDPNAKVTVLLFRPGDDVAHIRWRRYPLPTQL